VALAWTEPVPVLAANDVHAAGVAGADVEAQGAAGTEARSEGTAGRRSAARPPRTLRTGAVGSGREREDVKVPRGEVDAATRTRLEQRVFGGRGSAVEKEELRAICLREHDRACGERLKAVLANQVRDF
jgi:hypothetical protein